MAPLLPEDGHDLCPACLGVPHLREGLTGDACMNCSVLPYALRAARLAALEDMELPPSGQQSAPTRDGLPKKRSAVSATSTARKRRRVVHPKGLSSKVGELASEMAQMKSLLESLQARGGGVDSPQEERGSAREEDVLSVAASDSQFRDPEVFDGSEASEFGSESSSCSQGGDESASASLRVALHRLNVEIPTEQAAVSNAFFRRQTPAPSFSVPPSTDYLRELHACWSDTKAFSKPTSDGRALASMQDAPKFGLGHMPAVETAVASLIVAPDEALRPNARCPRPQCRVTDELLCRAYDAGSRMGRVGNSLSHLLLSLASSLEGLNVDAPTLGLLDTSLQAFALMSRELGRLLSTLTQARRQVWLAQSPLTETCRRTLRSLPVVPGELFGAAALDALQRTALASQTRQQLAGLHRRAPLRTGSAEEQTRHQPGRAESDPFVAPRRPPSRSSRSLGEQASFRVSHQTRAQSGQPSSGRLSSRPFKGRGNRK